MIGCRGHRRKRMNLHISWILWQWECLCNLVKLLQCRLAYPESFDWSGFPVDRQDGFIIKGLPAVTSKGLPGIHLNPQPPPMHVQADASKQNTKTTPEPKYWLLHCEETRGRNKKLLTKVEDPTSKSNKKGKKSKGNEGFDQISVLKEKGNFSLLLYGRDQDGKEGGIYGHCYGQVLQNHLPENFSWVLQYMSTVIRFAHFCKQNFINIFISRDGWFSGDKFM